MEKDNLRRADLLTSILIILFGVWVVWEATKMPMKDSWGGVQNVWFVSPALFPLFVGSAIIVLGLILLKVAVSSIGASKVPEAIRSTLRGAGISRRNLKFICILILLFFFVYVDIPRVDFIIASLLFLFVFISAFHMEDWEIFKRLFRFYLAGVLIFIVYFALGFGPDSLQTSNLATDVLHLAFLAAYMAYAWRLVRGDAELRRRMKHAIVVSIISPLALGPAFKFFLLVPLPTEGIIVRLMETIRYWEF